MTLPHIDGLDTAAGLTFFAGRADVYLRALHTFAALYASGLPLPAGGVAHQATDARTPGLQQAAHSLAGASLVLGAAAVAGHAQRLAAVLATAGADAAQTGRELRAMQHALADLVQQLRARLPAA